MGLFEDFFKNAKDLFIICAADGSIVEITPSWENQLGWSLLEIKSKPLFDFLHEEDRDRIKFEMIQGQNALDIPYISGRFLHKNGSYRWLSWSFKKSSFHLSLAIKPFPLSL